MSKVNEKKFNEWRKKSLEGNDSVSVVVRGRDDWSYIYRGESAIIEAMKIWTDKGDGYKEILSFKDGVSPEGCNLSMLMKGSTKLIFRDNEGVLHGFGFNGAQTSLIRFCAYLKASTLNCFVFACAEDNRVNVIEKIIDSENEAISKCLFENSVKNEKSEKSGEVITDERFFERFALS